MGHRDRYGRFSDSPGAYRVTTLRAASRPATRSISLSRPINARCAEDCRTSGATSIGTFVGETGSIETEGMKR